MHAHLAEDNSEPCAFDFFFLNHTNCTWKEFFGVNLLGCGIYKVCSNLQFPVGGWGGRENDKAFFFLSLLVRSSSNLFYKPSLPGRCAGCVGLSQLSWWQVVM